MQAVYPNATVRIELEQWSIPISGASNIGAIVDMHGAALDKAVFPLSLTVSDTCGTREEFAVAFPHKTSLSFGQKTVPGHHIGATVKISASASLPTVVMPLFVDRPEE